MSIGYYLSSKGIEKRGISLEDPPLWVDSAYSSKASQRFSSDILKLLEKEHIPINAVHRFFASSKDFLVTEIPGALLFSFIIGQETHPARSEKWQVMLTPKTLFTFHPPESALLRRPSFLEESPHNSFEILLSVIAYMIERTGEVLSRSAGQCDDLSIKLFMHGRSIPPHNRSLSQAIIDAGKLSILLMKIQQSLEMMTNLCLLFRNEEKMMNFVPPSSKTPYVLMLDMLSNQIATQQNLANSLVQNVSYLSDASIGMVSINQNNLMMFLTLLATILVPPAIIVSIFQVQFPDTPFVPWYIGYGAMFISMIASAFFAYKALQKRTLT